MLRCGALSLLQKPLHYKGGLSRNRAQLFCMRALAQLLSCDPRPSLIQKVIDRGVQVVVRGGARCASQVLDRGAQYDARGAARCALHVHGRGARADASGRSFAVLSTQVSTVGLRLRLVVPRPIAAAVATRCCRSRF